MGSARNEFIRKRNERDQKFLDAGEQMGMQKMWDYMQQALRETEVVGPVIFGRNRLEKLYKRVSELADHYHPAFTAEREADNRQEELDGVLKEVWGKDMVPFYERYPYLKKIGYDKPQKGWVD